jgi:Flp pilus assembly protein TadB
LYRNGNPLALPPPLSRSWDGNQKENQKGDRRMLWTLFVILLIAWLIGLIGFHVVAWYIHILLVLALVVLVIQLITGRRAAL